jgi:hypothetical protein
MGEFDSRSPAEVLLERVCAAAGVEEPKFRATTSFLAVSVPYGTARAVRDAALALEASAGESTGHPDAAGIRIEVDGRTLLHVRAGDLLLALDTPIDPADCARAVVVVAELLDAYARTHGVVNPHAFLPPDVDPGTVFTAAVSTSFTPAPASSLGELTTSPRLVRMMATASFYELRASGCFGDPVGIDPAGDLLATLLADRVGDPQSSAPGGIGDIAGVRLMEQFAQELTANPHLLEVARRADRDPVRVRPGANASLPAADSLTRLS